MAKWRVIPSLPLQLAIGQYTTIGEAFPDAYKMPIAARLREWDIDIRTIPIELYPGQERGILAAAGPAKYDGPPEGTLWLSLAIKNYTDKEKYITISHELAHLLQFVEGRIDPERATGYWTLHQWISLEHETDATRWAARQAKAMGMSEQAYMRYEAKATGHELELETRKITHPIFTGEWPEEHGVRPMFTGGKPFVQVRRYKRRQRRR